jgi:hypothetical protein
VSQTFPCDSEKQTAHSEVASAQVDGNGHVLGSIFDGRVDELSILSGERIQVLSSTGCCFSHVQVAQVSKIGIIELDKGASSFGESLDFRSISGSQILEEVVEVGVGSNINRSSSTSEVSLWYISA